MPLHTLIIGHSICKWLEHYLLTKKDRRLSADFNIKEMTTVAWHGIGGRTLIQLIKHDIRIVQNRKTDCGVLIVGGNDVTEESSADEIAFKIITLGTLLVNRCKVGRVVICALTTRFPMSEFRFKKYGKTEEKVLRFTGGFARRFFI
jgi:hypothetical protein